MDHCIKFFLKVKKYAYVDLHLSSLQNHESVISKSTVKVLFLIRNAC